MTFLVGVFLGAGIGVAAAALLLRVSVGREARLRIDRRGELLRIAKTQLDRYGESRHLATAISRELADDAGA